MSSAHDDDAADDDTEARSASIPDDPAAGGTWVGRRIGAHYTVEALHGEGSIGRTYRAKRDHDGRSVALKLPHHRLKADETFMRRLTRDVDASRQLEHLHVAQIYEQATDEVEGPFICREWIDGEDIVSAVRRAAATPRRLCELLIQVLSALSEAQRRGLLHGNLKPQNILVTHDAAGRELVKVCDFGNPQRARPGAEYMAPEHADGPRVDGQADVYASGVVLYELLTGEVPFRAATPAATLALQRSEPLVPPRLKRPDLPMPRELEAVCLKALAKDPRERHKSPREMSQALRAVISLLGTRADEPLGSAAFSEGGVVADTASGDRVTMPGEQLRSRTKFWLGAALLAGVCVAVWLNPAHEQAPGSHSASTLSAAKQNGAAALASGVDQLRQGETQTAVTQLRNARRALGDTPEVLRALGEALVIQGNHEEGSALLARYLQLEPEARDRNFVESLLRRASTAGH